MQWCGKRKGGEAGGGRGIHGLRTWSGRTLKVHKEAMADEQAVVYVIGHSFPRREQEQDTRAKVETGRPPKGIKERPLPQAICRPRQAPAAQKGRLSAGRGRRPQDRMDF